MFVKVIPQSHCMIVERFGKPVRVVYGGLHFFIPVIDLVKSVKDNFLEGFTYDPNRPWLIELSEQLLDTKPRQYFTKDNIAMNVNCALRWRITDPIKAAYEVDHLHNALIETTLSEVRSYVGAHDLNHILSNRQSISEHMNATLAETARRWGVNVLGVEIQELAADEQTIDAMRQQLEASRKAEATKLMAQGEAEAVIKRAQAEAEALRLRAASESDYLKMLMGAIGKDGAVKVILADKILEAYKALAKEPSNKIFMAMPEKMNMVMNGGMAGAPSNSIDVSQEN